MRKPKRKVLLIEVETVLSNEALRSLDGLVFENEDGIAVEYSRRTGRIALRIVQVQVNDVGPKAKAVRK